MGVAAVRVPQWGDSPITQAHHGPAAGRQAA